MSRRKERAPSPERGRSRALRTWGFYLLALTAWVTVVLAVSITGFLLCRSILWYETNPLYQLLNWIRDYYFFVLIAAILLGWVVISYFFIGRPVRNLELLLAGAEELAHPTDTPIRLPRRPLLQRRLHAARVEGNGEPLGAHPNGMQQMAWDR